MKVALIVRSTLFTTKGGDTVQVVQTAGHLRRYGVRADIRLANEPIDYNSYHLLHFFNLTRPADILAIASSTVKLFGFCTAGNSLKVSVNLAAAACAA